jgi:arginine decarboxylase
VSGRVPARLAITWLRDRLVTELAFDPRDPLGLRADAPMLAAWLDFTRQAEAGELLPMSVPGHKQRQDLVGAVVAGDAPFYGGLDTIKNADNLRVESEGRAARLWGAD